ncbi:mating type mat1-2-3 [Fusarium longipes]|uniref:Mating type mat1-2-3 n=1 Tax=Fusarium longipes TaxID=694270 RepID=A0A395RTW1_9HYPO|nr:mating type mat1-2-3 [Fusarium longipes]
MESQSQPQAEARASSPDRPSMPTRATAHDIRAILSGPALGHLAPVPGGRWRLVSQTMNSIVVAYHVNHRAVLTTTIQMGANPALVTDQCWQYVYGYPTGVASLVDGALPAWTPPVFNVGNQAQERESLTQLYNQMLDANSIMATGVSLHRSGGLPSSSDTHLPEVDDFSASMLDHEGTQSQAQAPNEPVAAHMVSLQNTHPVNMAENESGDIPAFQNLDNSMLSGANSFMFHDGNGDEVNANPQWNSFSETS